MNWINVKDELPETKTAVVGFHDSQLVPVVCFLSQKIPYPIWCLVTCCFYTENMDTIKTVSGKITHWMPLPEKLLK